ncbi:MAG: acyltransferase [Deltaproteobacteria bacterium]
MSFFSKTSSGNIQIDSLDGLRGFAMLLVLLSHTSTAFGPIIGVIFTGSGKYGVYLFFTLSSFLLSLPLLGKDDLFTKATWARYSKRRFLRIYPLFAAVLIINYLIHATSGLDLYLYHSPYEIIKALLLIEEKGVFWSIAVEFKYYLVLPFVIIVFRKVFKNDLLSSAVFVIFIAALTEFLWPRANYAENSIALMPYLPIFLFGSLSALVYIKISEAGVRVNHPLVAPLPYTSLCMILITIPAFWGAFTGTEVAVTRFHKHYYFYGVLWPVFMLSFLMRPGLITSIFSSKALRFLGFISFSAYLWHEFMISLIKNHLGIDGQIGIALVFASTFLLSAISYLLFEKPFVISRRGPASQQGGGLFDIGQGPIKADTDTASGT